MRMSTLAPVKPRSGEGSKGWTLMPATPRNRSSRSSLTSRWLRDRSLRSTREAMTRPSFTSPGVPSPSAMMEKVRFTSGVSRTISSAWDW